MLKLIKSNKISDETTWIVGHITNSAPITQPPTLLLIDSTSLPLTVDGVVRDQCNYNWLFGKNTWYCSTQNDAVFQMQVAD